PNPPEPGPPEPRRPQALGRPPVGPADSPRGDGARRSGDGGRWAPGAGRPPRRTAHRLLPRAAERDGPGRRGQRGLPRGVGRRRQRGRRGPVCERPWLRGQPASYRLRDGTGGRLDRHWRRPERGGRTDNAPGAPGPDRARSGDRLVLVELAARRAGARRSHTRQPDRPGGGRVAGRPPPRGAPGRGPSPARRPADRRAVDARALTPALSRWERELGSAAGRRMR